MAQWALRLTATFFDKSEVHQVPAKVFISNNALKDGTLFLNRKNVERSLKNFCGCFCLCHIYLLTANGSSIAHLRTPKIHSVITSVRGGCYVGIAHAHLNGIRIQDRVAVDLIAHPPVERGLWIAASVNDLL